MLNKFKKFISLAFVLSLLAGTAIAATVLPVPQGGTGTTTLTGVIVGNGTSAFSPATISSPITFGSGSIGCQTVSVSQGGCLTAAQYSSLTTGQVTTTSALTGTSAQLPPENYDNGIAGVGAFMIATSNGALPAQNGVTLVLNDRLLVKNNTDSTENGVYVLTQLGTVSTRWILTRATDSDTSSELDNQVVVVTSGTLATATPLWAQTTGTPSVGSSVINYVNIRGTGVTQAVSGSQNAGDFPCWTTTARELSKVCATPLPVGQGGTGFISGTSGGIPYFSSTATIASSAALTANRIVLGGGAGATPTVTASLGTTTTLLHGNAAGAPTFGQVATGDIANNAVGNAQFRTGIARSVVGVTGNATTNVADIQGTANQALVVNAAGTALAFGTVGVAGGGTGAVTFTANSVLIGNNTTNIATSAPGTNGQIFTGQTSNPPLFKTATLNATGGTFGIDANAVYTLPDAAISTRGLVTSTTQTFDGNKTINGNISVKHDIAQANAVTNTPGSGAGTAPSVTVNGFDHAGHISVTTGTTPALGSIIVTVIYNVAYGAIPNVVFSPTNSSAGLISPSVYISGSGVNSFALSTNTGVALTAATTYTWDYIVVGNNA